MTSTLFALPAPELPESAEALRTAVRAFLAEERRVGGYVAGIDTWLGGFDPAFSAKLGRHGWLGMTLPVEYGGQGQSALQRFVVIEELLAAGAPVAAHWFADRQIGPSLMNFGSEQQRRRFIPEISRGECFFAIGLSEPDSGSDLASVRTRAVAAPNGWLVSGTKVWTSGAHRCHFMLALVRTGADRQLGLSQMIIDLTSPGVTIRPITFLTGEHHFNEIILEDVFVPEDMVLGNVGNGWKQVNSELAYERSGPERFLSTFQIIVELCRHAATTNDRRALAELGSLYSQLWSIRLLSLRVAGALVEGVTPETAAALVKDLGTQFEQDCIEAIRRGVGALEVGGRLDELLWQATLHSPGFTLRGGTSEVMRILIARGLVS